jgi:hypothetical protein
VKKKKKKKEKIYNKDMVVKTWFQALPTLVILENQFLVIPPSKKNLVVKTSSKVQLE